MRTNNPNWDVLAIDMRGQGLTLAKEHRVGQFKVKINEQSKLIEKVLEKLEITECFVIGLSYAGAVSLDLALTCPDRVLGLGLIAPYVTNFKTYKKGMTGIYYHLLDKHPAKQALAVIGLPLYFHMAKYDHRLNSNKNWDFNEMDALTKLTLGVLEFNTKEALAKLHDLPLGIHLLCGFHDRVIPISAHKQFYHNIPTHLTRTFSLEEDVGHRIFENHPEVAADWVQRLLTAS